MVKPAVPEEEREFAFSDREFRFLAELANKKTGIQLPPQKRDMVYSRLTRRLRALKLTSFAQYCDLVSGPAGEEEMGHLVNAITTNLTHFFREGHHFEHLRDYVLQPLIKGGSRKLRIWSAGCSSGMEPYSIAMTVKHTLKDVAAWDAKILATDIDTNMLARGQKGEYTADEYGSIPAEYRADVSKNGDVMQMSDALRRLIAFNHLNLLEHWPMKGMFDAIFCRNVVIYFDKATQEKLFARMAKHLSPQGFLYIGHSENITKICPQFELIGRTIYRHAR
ncbi:MAG: protein-glutamate O-methyltransferase [Rickettsiales bacterium]|nr:protein-glutamate O-methyltransferase [Rickettsiales bacterium]